ncbi:H-SHIPPO_1 [Hexamita inflata]|uniref:H-SHIPPO 1 n=1 Tax=Hexamita inflata TaxID=28002 RepID=A0AA86NEL1_9EUKA|nr:H-SHIPPO 1 [Hexamita inflata]CAI9941244.1 H-SHIPPO 1 [Hexamita inflata]
MTVQLGLDPRLDFIDKTPGPGAYDVTSADKYKESPIRQYTFSIRPKTGVKLEGPGPNHYAPVIQQENIKQSLGYPYRKFKNATNPGPADYAPVCKAQSNIKHTFAARTKLFSGANIGPGPAAFDVNINLSAQKTISDINLKMESPRKSIFLNNIVAPAPNAYTIITKAKSAGYSFRPRTKDVFKNNNPGPGAYDQILKEKPKGFTMSSRVKRGWVKY